MIDLVTSRVGLAVGRWYVFLRQVVFGLAGLELGPVCEGSEELVICSGEGKGE